MNKYLVALIVVSVAFYATTVLSLSIVSSVALAAFGAAFMNWLHREMTAAAEAINKDYA